jgi:glycosylphosphatidylinositol transamidase
LIGVAWLLLLPLNEYSRSTYISENALLPGQVHTYFAGSDQNIFRAFKQEVDGLSEAPTQEYDENRSLNSLRLTENNRVNDKLEGFLQAAGLKVARQKYKYVSAGRKYDGENIYAILHAPRGDATEAIVLVGPWRNMNGELNRSGVALVLTLARYFKSRVSRKYLFNKMLIMYQGGLCGQKTLYS